MDDAETDLGIARSLVDSNRISWQFWPPKVLPLVNLLMLPFIGNKALWQTGLAGSIPSFFCYVAAVAGLYRIALNRWGFRGATGAIEHAGLPFRRFIDISDGARYNAALQSPASSAAFAVTAGKDPMAQAIAAHSGDFDAVGTYCGRQGACAPVFQARLFSMPVQP
jgi:hypothetical protein